MTPKLFPHCRMKSSSRHSEKFKPGAAFVIAPTRRDWGCVIEDKLWFSCLRSAGRFVSSRWLCVRRPSPYPLVPLPHGLTMAQGGMPALIMPDTMRGNTPTITIGR
jgi:hypothetical protein